MQKDQTQDNLGVVFYADGSAKPNPGTATFGVHGYSYNITGAKAPTFKYDFTTLGYKKKETQVNETNEPQDDSVDDDEEEADDRSQYSAKDPNKILGVVAQENNVLTKSSQAVYPIEVYDIYGYVGENTNNNVAEIEAAKAAINCAVEKGYKKIDIITDSISTVQCFNTWIYKWAQNNWKKADGTTLKNLQYMQDLHRYLSDVTAQGYRYNLHWIEGHAGHYGNERADQNADHAHNHKETVKTQRPSQSHFNFKTDKPSFFYLPSLIGSIQSSIYNGKHVYILTNKEKKTQLYGTKSNFAAYSVILSKEPVPVVQSLFQACEKLQAHDTKYILIDLTKLYNKTAALDIDDLKNKAFTKTDQKSFVVGTAHCPDIAVQLDAPMMVHTVFKICNDSLNEVTDAIAQKPLQNIFVHNVTDQFFTTNDKGKTSVVKHFNHTDKTFTLEFELFGEKSKEQFVPGQCFAARSVFKDLEGKNCTVYLITKQTPEVRSWKYYFYITTDQWDMLNIPGYANVRLKLTPEQQLKLSKGKKK